MKKKIFLFLFLLGCASKQIKKEVELANIPEIRKMGGKWYVLAHIPFEFESQAYEAKKHFKIIGYGKIEENYFFKEKSFSSPQLNILMQGRIEDLKKKSIWKMSKDRFSHFVYHIYYLNKKYSLAILGTKDMKHLWLLARYKKVSSQTWNFLKSKVEKLGFDLKLLRFIPHEVHPTFDGDIYDKSGKKR